MPASTTRTSRRRRSGWSACARSAPSRSSSRERRTVWGLGLAGDAVTVAQSAITGALGGCPDAGSRRAGRDHRRVRCRAGSSRACRGPPDAAGVVGRFGSPDVCAAALRRLCGSGHRGLVATDNGRMVAVMTATARQHPAAGRYARLPDEGLAVGPELADPTGVLAAAFGDLASPLIVGGGVLRYYLRPAAAPPARGAVEPRVRAQRRLWHPAGGAAVPLLSHRRAGCRDRAPRYHRPPDPGRTTAPLRTTGIRTPPGPSPRRPGRRAPRLARPRRRLPSGHPRRVRRRPAHHRADLAGPAPVPDGQPYIGPHRYPPGARPRRRTRARRRRAQLGICPGYQWVSVDFDTANPLSRPFWLNVGFRPAGYGRGV